MTIQSTTGFQSYKNYVSEIKNAELSISKGKDGRVLSAQNTETQNTDTVSFSGSAAAQAELGRASLRMATEVEELGNEERLAQLSQEISQGRYFVSSDALASSILGEA